jgi:hypothetical protein
MLHPRFHLAPLAYCKEGFESLTCGKWYTKVIHTATLDHL